jgi:murein DD-endopeptidase MepM/ murein hydrolase activator NlpD
MPYIGQMILLRTIVCLFFCLAALPAAAQNIALSPPLDCTIGVECWIQQYVDHDPTARAQDYRCGAETYDGHDGTDFRIRDTSARISVVASFAGTVKAIRNNVDDRLLKSEADRLAVRKIECGNGVVIDHTDGWQTQYCHMRKGSVLVKAGTKVDTGTKLGDVGYSGAAAFAHVHLTLRHNGKVVDPFGSAAACADKSISLWDAAAQKTLTYHQGDIIGTGFHYATIDLANLETGLIKPENPTSSWPGLVAYAWAINLSVGDEIRVTLQGPDDLAQSNTKTLDVNKAQYLLFAGKKQPAGGWPPGTYRGAVTIKQGPDIRLHQEWQAEIK